MIFKRRRQHTVLSFLLSFVIHLFIIGFLLTGAGYWYHMDQAKASADKKAASRPIVKAVAVNQSVVENQIRAIKTRAKMKLEKQLAWQAHLQQMAEQAVAKKTGAEQHLAELQKENQQVKQLTEKMQDKARAQLAYLRALQAQAEAKLNMLQAQQKAIETQNTAISKKMLLTQKAIANEQSSRQKAALQARLQKEQAKQAALKQQQLFNQLSKYKTLILNDIGKQWIIPPGAKKNVSCKLLVDLDAMGRGMNVKVLVSSGDPVLDRSAVTAVLKASPLPLPKIPALLKQFKQIELTVKPEGLLNEEVNLS